MYDKFLLRIAKTISWLFSPHIFPLASFLLLFRLTFLSLLPWTFALYVISIVTVFTIGLPVLATWLYRLTAFHRHIPVFSRRRRYIPYLINIVSYMMCRSFLSQLCMPSWVYGVILASLLLQCMCALVNLRWKVSVHSAASGAVCGGLIAFSIIFSFNPVWWLCVAILLSGMVGSARMILRQHSLMEVVLGSIIGFACGLIGVL